MAPLGMRKAKLRACRFLRSVLPTTIATTLIPGVVATVPPPPPPPDTHTHTLSAPPPRCLVLLAAAAAAMGLHKNKVCLTPRIFSLCTAAN